MRYRIATLMKLVAACGLKPGLCSWLGWEAATVIVPGIVAYLLVIKVPLYGLLMASAFWAPLGQPVITCTLVGGVLTGTSAMLVGLFLTEPDRIRLAQMAFTGGFLVGLVIGIMGRVSARNDPNFPYGGPDGRRKALRRNVSLAIAVMALFAALWVIPKLKWGGRGSVGLAVSADGNGRLSVDFYGRAVNSRTIELVLSRRLSPGSVERIDLLGYSLGMGFVADDPKPGDGTTAVRRIAFHATEVNDSVIPLLKRFRRLEWLDLRDARISEDGLGELRTALPGCRIVR